MKIAALLIAFLVLYAVLLPSNHAKGWEPSYQSARDDKVITQAKEDYQAILKCYNVLNPDVEPKEIHLLLSELLKSETYEAVDGSIQCIARPVRGIIVHELLHAFGYTIRDKRLREEFFCTATQFLLDGFTPNTELKRKKMVSNESL